MRVQLQNVFRVPHDIFSAPRLGANIILAQDAACGEDEREVAIGALVGRHELGEHEAALAARELRHVHDGRAFRRFIVTWPLHATETIELLEADAAERWRDAGDLIHDR